MISKFQANTYWNCIRIGKFHSIFKSPRKFHIQSWTYNTIIDHRFQPLCPGNEFFWGNLFNYSDFLLFVKRTPLQKTKYWFWFIDWKCLSFSCVFGEVFTHIQYEPLWIITNSELKNSKQTRIMKKGKITGSSVWRASNFF